MAEHSDNLDPKEATEAKLCAYLEGELSPAERIEIEQHLAANPQHRQLLVELAKTRDWMRSIPRETSPMDLGELFRGQVERAMLLDDSADQSSGMSINRWPQYVLVAAITVLTLGLGVVLVAILKSPTHSTAGAGGTRPNTYALAPVAGAATSPVAPMGIKESGGRPLADASAAPAPTPLATPTSPGAAATTGLNEADRNRDAERAMAPAEARENTADVDELKTRLYAAGVRVPADQKMVCFVVSADAPAESVDQVRGFFDRHQIAFDSSPAQAGSYAQNGGPGAAFGSVSKNAGGVQTRLANASKAAGGNDNFIAGANADQPQNALPNQLKQSQANNLPNTNNPNNAVQNSLNTVTDKISPLTPAVLPAGETLYVAHGMTPLQLELLNASLLGDNLKQTVERVTLSSGQIPQVQDEAKQLGAIARGQTLTITIPQLVGPGIEKTNVVKVADDGTITLPMIDPLQANGTMPEELQRRITDKYREANLIREATVSVAVAAPPASTQPLAAALRASTQPATQPLRDLAMKDMATTQPVARAAPAAATPGTHPAVDSSLVDVVVVVQQSKYPIPAPVPAAPK